MKTRKRLSRRSHSGLPPIVQLSAGSSGQSPRQGNLKACLRAATKRLGTSLIDLLLDMILCFTTDKDAPPAVAAPIGQPQAGDRHA
jgi:hypothetical protein